jgi:hypothetical protein
MGSSSWAAFAFVAVLAAPAPVAAEKPRSESLEIRGRAQSLRLYGGPGGPVAVVASGDGGWIHLGPYVAELLAGRGYFVVGFDSKAYLAGFTRGGETLAPKDVPGDFRTLVDYATRAAPSSPVLIGVSEGAALAVLAAADDSLKHAVAGVVVLGLPEKVELGWRLSDSLIYVTKGVPNEPLFATAEVVGRVSPLPLVALHSTRAEFVPVREEVKRVMDRAAQPKQLWIIDAQNHRFSGSERELDRKLLEAIAWLKTARR